MFKHKSTSFHEAYFDSQNKPRRPDTSMTNKRNSEMLQNVQFIYLSQPPELLAKLYQVNRSLEQNIIRLNVAEEEIQQKDSELKDLKLTIKQLTNCLNDSQNQILLLQNQIRQFKTQLKQQDNLPKLKKHNEQLFQDYQTVLIQNQNYQQQIIELQDQLNCISYRLRESEQAIQLIKQTETKVGYIEYDIYRLEEQQQRSIPELTQQIQRSKIQQEAQVQILNCGIDYIISQFNKSTMTITKQLQILQRHNKSNLLISAQQLSFNGLNQMANQVKDQKMYQIVKKLNFSEHIQDLVEGLLTFSIQNCKEILCREIDKKLEGLEMRINGLSNVVVQFATAYDFSRFRKNSNKKCDLTSYSCQSRKKNINKENDCYQSVEIFDCIANKLNDQFMRLEQLHQDLLIYQEMQTSQQGKDLQFGLKLSIQNHEVLTNFVKKELLNFKSSFIKQQKSNFMPKIF